MTEDTSNTLTVMHVLEAFAQRGLELIDIEHASAHEWRARFDLDGHRLHLPFDERHGDVFSLELRDAIHLDERRHPGIALLAGTIVNELHARVPHVRFVFSALNDAASDDTDDVIASELLVSLLFSAPLYGPLDERIVRLFDTGLDALFYALARLYDDLAAHGVEAAAAVHTL